MVKLKELVTRENLLTGDTVHANTAYLTFVSIDDAGHPAPTIPVVPDGEEEQRRYRDAERRRELRLLHRRRD